MAPEKRRRIKFISRSDWRSPAANAVQQTKTAHALARQGAQVEYVVRSTRFVRADDVLGHYGLSNHPNLKVCPVSSPANPRLSYRVFQAKLMLRLVSETWLSPSRVVLTREPSMLLAVRALGGKGIYEAHDLNDLDFRFQISEGSRQRHYQALIKANGIVTVTKSGSLEMQRLLGVSAERICVAPDAAEAQAYPPPRQELRSGSVVQLMYCGSLWQDRGVETLVRALPHLPLSVRLLMVGGPLDQIKPLQMIALDQGTLDRIEFVGHRPHCEMVDWLTRADILVLPMLKNRWADLYASPMKLFEYMATGRPLAVADVPTVREVVDESSAVFFTPENAVSLATSIRWIIDHWNSALTLSTHARELLAQRYTYDHRAQRILSLIESVC